MLLIKQIDIFKKEAVVFPINLGNMHWTAGAINLKLKRFEYYDSLSDHGTMRDRVFQVSRFP